MNENRSVFQKLSALCRIVVQNPRIILFAVFLVSGVVALFTCPEGMALEAHFSESGWSGGNYVPTPLYLLVGGGFMAAFTFGGGRDGTYNIKAWLCLLGLLVFHFYFLKASMV